MVKRSRAQSHEAPNRLSWRMMVPPDSSFHCQTRAVNTSRPRSSFVLPSSASCCSTLTWVAIPAWSVPGSQSALKPSMRL